MKKVFFIVALTAASFAGFAQSDKEASKPLSFSVGVEAGLPTGDWKDVYSLAIGGSVQADYKVAPELAITLNAGYLNFSGKDGFESSGVVPVLAGAKYFFSPNIYGSGQLGITFSTATGGGSNFTYAPGVGFKFSQFDILAKYTGYSVKGGGSASLVGIRAAYNF